MTNTQQVAWFFMGHRFFFLGGMLVILYMPLRKKIFFEGEITLGVG
ncbi:MAG: hypothetical protein ACI83D_000326 [Planctomycetota bacterium]|jgi:hypothetical protein